MAGAKFRVIWSRFVLQRFEHRKRAPSSPRLGYESLESRNLLSITAQLVGDLVEDGSSAFSGFTDAGESLYFYHSPQGQG